MNVFLILYCLHAFLQWKNKLPMKNMFSLKWTTIFKSLGFQLQSDWRLCSIPWDYWCIFPLFYFTEMLFLKITMVTSLLYLMTYHCFGMPGMWWIITLRPGMWCIYWEKSRLTYYTLTINVLCCENHRK